MIFIDFHWFPRIFLLDLLEMKGVLRSEDATPPAMLSEAQPAYATHTVAL